MTIYILGGGPAGLALAQGLTDNKEDFVLIERDTVLGGLAKTVLWEGVGHHDLGPHKIFSIDEELTKRVNRLIAPSDWITRDKKATIFMGGHYLPYPPSPFSLLHIYGLVAFVRMCVGFGFAKLLGWMRTPFAKTFEQDLNARVGYPLYDKLFRPIAEKLWGNPKKLDIKLSRGRVQIPSILEIVAGILGVKGKSSFEAHDFSYPKGGLKSLWEAIAKNVSQNGKILTGHSVEKFECGDNAQITAIHMKNLGTGRDEKMTLKAGDYVVSTLPLAINARFLSNHLSQDALFVAKNIVKLNDLLLVFLHIEDDELTENSWIFVPDPDIIFHRVSEQNSFDTSMVPSGSIVCCEVMSSEMRPMATRDDEDLIEACINDLGVLGLGKPNVKASKVMRLPKSYPVYEAGFEAHLEKLLAEFDGFPNFKTIGRQGAFNYIGTLDAMDIGFGAARWLANRENDWAAERERTEHFPVLD